MTVPDDIAATPAALLEKWGKITEAATRGPWAPAGAEVETEWVIGPGYSREGERMRIANLVMTVGKYEREKANAQFIAEARTAMPRLLAAVEAALKLADDHAVPGLQFRQDGKRWWDLDPAKLREAITAELTGEGAGGR